MLAMLSEALTDAAQAICALVAEPQERTFAPFLVASAVIAFAVTAVRTRSLGRGWQSVWDPRVWLHPSALMDARLIALNTVVRALVLAPIGLSALAVATATVRGLHSSLGPAATSSWSHWQIVAVYTVVLFVAWDASRYAVHWLLHRIPMLWEFHKVHHSAEVLTPFTVYRVHPVESFLFGLRGALTTGLVTGVFFYLFRSHAVQYELLGVNAVGLVLNAAGANLRHSHVWLSYGRVVERFLISPAQHQLHHSTDPADYDCNYGSFLAVWDWLGGTLRLAARQPRGFGLSPGEQNHHPHRARSALTGPIAALARRCLARLNFWEKRYETTTS
jgi:sterol desaturase/sphingolipid hydroxylase (fatty acid hydroxylase superfamily)